MARFYGELQGGRGKVSRLGHAAGGLYVSARSYTGSVIVTLSVVRGVDCVRIAMVKGSNPHGDRILYYGPVSELLEIGPDPFMLPSHVGG